MNSRVISAGKRGASLYWIVRFAKGGMAILWGAWGMTSGFPAPCEPHPVAHSATAKSATSIFLIRTGSPPPPHSPPPAAGYPPPTSTSKPADRCGPWPPRPPPRRLGRPCPPPWAAPDLAAAHRCDRPSTPIPPPPLPDFLQTPPIARDCTHETPALESAAARAWAPARHSTRRHARAAWPDAARCAVPPIRALLAHPRHIAPAY